VAASLVVHGPTDILQCWIKFAMLKSSAQARAPMLPARAAAVRRAHDARVKFYNPGTSTSAKGRMRSAIRRRGRRWRSELPEPIARIRTGTAVGDVALQLMSTQPQPRYCPSSSYMRMHLYVDGI
jgi:hypothetical protein